MFTYRAGGGLGNGDDDDGLPDIPTTDAQPLTLAEQQMRRMTALEEEVRRLHKPASPCSSSSASELASGETGEGAHCRATAPADAPDSVCFDTERLLSELRTVVPHLSPQFTCSYQDCHLLLAAIRNGGATSASGQLSIAQKLQSVEAENRGLQHKCERQQESEQILREELGAARQATQVAQDSANRRTALLSQRAEEYRKQVLMEEGRSQRLQVKVKQLEAEMDTLRDRLRAQLR